MIGDLPEAARLAVTITLPFRDEGSRENQTRARLVFLREAWGVEKLRWVVEDRWGRPLRSAGKVSRSGNRADHLGGSPQKQAGLCFIGLCVPTGRTYAYDMTDLARLAQVYGSGAIRLAVDWDAIIAGVPDARLSEV